MSEHNEDIAKELAEKSKKLEHAAINLAPEEIAKTCAKLGKLEYTARALGIACRFRGVECVKALVKGGAGFHAPLTNYMVQTYGCLLYTSPSPRDRTRSRMPSSA